MNILRICFVSPLPPPYGGIAHWTSMIAAHASSRTDVDVVVVNIAQRWRSIHSTGVLLRAVGGGLQLLRDLTRLFITLAGSRFDVVHLTTSGQLAVIRDLFVSYVAAIFGVGLVYHIRFGRIPVIAPAQTYEWRLIRRVMHRAATVIAIDKATFLTIQQFAPAVKLQLVPNFVDAAALPTPDDSSNELKTVLFVGWVIPAKGIGELIEAWTKVNSEGWRLQIVGPGDLSYQRRLLRQFQPKRVEFLGEVPHSEAMKRMAHCDLFVLPSYTEGFPNVVVEAMALSRAIVATAVGSVPEMLENDAGIVVRSKSVDALATALDAVMTNPNLRQKLARKAFKRARQIYTIEAVFGCYLSIWKQSAGSEMRNPNDGPLRRL